MLSCRVVEAARVLLTVEDYPALLALAEANQGPSRISGHIFKQYLLEIQSRALLAMGDINRHGCFERLLQSDAAQYR